MSDMNAPLSAVSYGSISFRHAISYFKSERQNVTFGRMLLPYGTVCQCQAVCAAGGRAFIAEQRLTRIVGRAHMPAVHMHTEALAGRGETCRWLSAAARASGDRVLANR